MLSIWTNLIILAVNEPVTQKIYSSNNVSENENGVWLLFLDLDFLIFALFLLKVIKAIVID